MATQIDGGKQVEPIPVRPPLTIAGKHRIVELFATFHTVAQIRDLFKAETGVELSKATIHHYDFTRNSKLSPRLKDYGEQVRKRYVEEAKDVAIAHQAHRLRKLEHIIEKATQSKDYNAALKGIELAAKEMGGLTQTVRHEGVVAHVHGSVEDARAEVAMRLAALVDAVPTLPPPTPTVEASDITVDVEPTPPADPTP